MPDQGFPVQVVRGVPVVAAPEEIDITNAEALRSALLQAAAGGHGPLVADLTRTRFCDSSGIHALLTAHKRAGTGGRELLLVIPNAAVLRVFALIGVDRMIPNFTSLPEALAHAAATANGRSRPQHDANAAPQAIGGPARAGDLPDTLKRSSELAQETFSRALASAVQVYGKVTRRSAPRTPSSRSRSRNAAIIGSRSRPLRLKLSPVASWWPGPALAARPGSAVPALHKRIGG
jgi:anti-sigma B factor antagonist